MYQNRTFDTNKSSKLFPIIFTSRCLDCDCGLFALAAACSRSQIGTALTNVWTNVTTTPRLAPGTSCVVGGQCWYPFAQSYRDI